MGDRTRDEVRSENTDSLFGNTGPEPDGPGEDARRRTHERLEPDAPRTKGHRVAGERRRRRRSDQTTHRG